MESLARMFGVPTLWRDREKVFESDITINVPALGIPAFLLEVGGGGVMERQQDARQAEFALSFLRGVDIITGNPAPEQFNVVEQYRIITPSRGGFFYPLVKPGDPVARARLRANRGRLWRRSRSPAFPRRTERSCWGSRNFLLSRPAPGWPSSGSSRPSNPQRRPLGLAHVRSGRPGRTPACRTTTPGRAAAKLPIGGRRNVDPR